MSNGNHVLSLIIFACGVIATLIVAFRGRRDARDVTTAALADQHLNRWLIGLSAGATANSGFVVTAAVGLGYTFGAHWLLLPLAWLLGDTVFWSIFPNRINAVGRDIRATTMTDLIVDGMSDRLGNWLRKTIAFVILFCLGGYVSAQWIAGQKFLEGAFDFGGVASLLTFATLIVIYTAIGGFRGSVYVDTLQAVIRIVGTVIAIVAVWVIGSRDPSRFWSNIESAGPTFFHIAPGGLLAAIPFILGFAAASLGFGLGQPQMVTRYLAGANPEETRSAWWIYNGFVQSTWIAMTVFGMALRGVMPSIADPEKGLSLFHRLNTGPVITGIITADIFATIAAAANGLLVAMAQTVSRDLFRHTTERRHPHELWVISAVLGTTTMMVSLVLNATVANLALSSVSLMGAGLAPAMLIRLLQWSRTDASLITTVITGTLTAALWHAAGWGAILNEAAPGIAVGLIVNYTLAHLALRKAQAYGTPS